MRPELRRRDRARAGMSLIELVVAIVVVSICMTGAFALVDSTVRRSVDPMLERQSTSVAEAYLEEILQRAFLDPDDGQVCPAPEAERNAFDNVCDYDGLSELGARNQSGAPIAGLEGYLVRVAIDRAANLGGLVGEQFVLRVDVTVSDPLGRPVLFSAYRTKA